MAILNLLVGSTVLGGCGVAGYLMHINSLGKFLEPVPAAVIAPYWAALHARMEHNDGSGSESGARPRFFKHAYTARAILPSADDLLEVFGKTTLAHQASFVAADGGKRVGSVFTDHAGNEALGALFALQSLEKAEPLKQCRAVALFWDNWQVSRQWAFLLHNRRDSLAAKRAPVHEATKAAEADAALTRYCEVVQDMTGETVVAADPRLRMAMMQESCGTAIGVALVPSTRSQPVGREAEMLVFVASPIPEGVEEGTWGYAARKGFSQFYSRWIAIRAAGALPKL